MSFDVFLQVLRTFEGFPTEFAFVRLEGNVDSDVRGNVVTFDSRSATGSPLAGEVQVVRALTTDMALADMVLFNVSIRSFTAYRDPRRDSTGYSHRALRQLDSVHHNLAIGKQDSRWQWPHSESSMAPEAAVG
jgi:hypothetical protein